MDKFVDKFVDKLLSIVAGGAGLMGVLACMVAGLARLQGHYAFWGYETLTLFIVGVGFMVFACLVKLYQLDNRRHLKNVQSDF